MRCIHHILPALCFLLSVISARSVPALDERPNYALAESGTTVTCSSELGKFKNKTYLASYVIDGDPVNTYWCSDFQNEARPPHWLELDLGQEREIGELVVNMVPRPGLLLDRFSLSVARDDTWVPVAECTAAPATPGAEDVRARYAVDAAPYGVYRVLLPSPAWVRRVRLVIDAPAIARVNQIQVLPPPPLREAPPRQPITPTGIVRFDLGGRGTPVAPGWIAVNDSDGYSDEFGYGWLNTDGLAGIDREVGYPITRDFVAGVRGAGTSARHTFRITLPRGQYAVAVVSGDLDAAVPPFSLAAQGVRVAERMGSGDRGGWDTRTFTVNAADGRVDLHVEGADAWLVNAILIAPVARFAEVLSEVEDIERTYAFRDPALLQGLTQRQPDTPRGDLRATEERKQRGYELVHIPTAGRIHATDMPAENQVTRTLQAQATAGENRALSVALHAFAALHNVRLTLSDLRGPGGVIPSAAVDTGWVRCWPQIEEKYTPVRRGEYMEVPELIHPLHPESELWVGAGTTRQFWLRIRVPETAAPGTYRGRIRFSASERPATELELNLEVLPFHLQWPQPMAWGIYYHPHRASSTAHLKADLEEMRLAGLTMFCFDSGVKRVTDGERVSWDLDPLARVLDLAREVGGFEGPYPLLIGSALPPGPVAEEKLAGMQDVIRFLEAERSRRQWPEFLYYLVDEPFNEEKIRTAETYYAAASQVDGIRTYCTVGWEAARRLAPWLDVRTHSPTVAQGFEWPNVRDAALADGDEFWYYTNCTRSVPDVMRMKSGFFFWKIRATGQTYWHYCAPIHTAFCDFDGNSRDHCTVYPGLDGPIRTIQWECHREGLYDAKYAYTLEMLIERARQAGLAPDRVAAAQAVLDDMASRINVDMAYYDAKYPVRKYGFHYNCEWEPAEFDSARTALIDAIMGLHNALPAR